MLPKDQVLSRLIRANVSFLLYGQKASGKTTKLLDLLNKNEANYILINCTLANKKVNFLKLFNVELSTYLKSRTNFQTHLRDPGNLDSWLTQIKKHVDSEPKLVQCLDNLIILMDNIQEMVMSENFVSAFYTSCQKQFKFKFSFIFCGTNFLKKQYSLELPFRTMISFCMPKPYIQYENIIRQTVQNTLKEYFKDKVSQIQLKKAIKTLTENIKASFDNVQFNLDKIKNITKAIVQGATSQLDAKQLNRSLSRMIQLRDLTHIIHQVKEFGPQQQSIMKRKINSIDNEQVYDINPNLQYYPNLILTSIHLADYYHQKQDKRRFHDYKGRSNVRNKDLKKNDFKIGRHNLQRIIAIADSLESQAKPNEKQKILQHHSLDFYAQFQHLKKIGRIKYNNNKIIGIVKEQESKAFMNKIDLKYQQFMSS